MVTLLGCVVFTIQEFYTPASCTFCFASTDKPITIPKLHYLELANALELHGFPCEVLSRRDGVREDVQQEGTAARRVHTERNYVSDHRLRETEKFYYVTSRTHPGNVPRALIHLLNGALLKNLTNSLVNHNICY